MKHSRQSRVFTTRRIAIVDGDRPAAEMLHTFFRLMELEPSLIAPGDDVLATLRRVEPDVALLDLDTSILQALEIAAEIRSQLPTVGIIFMSNDPAAAPAAAAPLIAKPGECFEKLLQLMELVLEV
jgi:DNA-binding NtrC family response regulator